MIDPVNALTEAEVEPLMDGGFLWMPYGFAGKGLVVQSKEELRSLRRYDALWLVSSAIFIAGFGLLLDVWAAIALAVFAFMMRIIVVKQIGRRLSSGRRRARTASGRE